MVKNKNSEMVQHSDFLISHLSHRSATLIEILTRRWGGEWVRVGGGSSHARRPFALAQSVEQPPVLAQGTLDAPT
jgi:hypothetical protein